MRAMILAAGLGTRLRPLTCLRPKTLVPVMEKSVLEYWVWQLYAAGFEAIVINAFHLHQELTRVVCEREWPIPVHVLVEPVLLGTGGGVRNALDFFQEEPFAVINGDIICKLDLKGLFQEHVLSGRPASLVLHDCPQFNNVAVGHSGAILGFGNEAIALARNHFDIGLFAFTGVHFIDPASLATMQAGSPGDILDAYRELIRLGNHPHAILPQGLFWREMGSLAAYRDLVKELGALPPDFLFPLQTGADVYVHPDADLGKGVLLEGYISIGRGSCVHTEAKMEDTILWDYVQVKPHSILRNCIVTDGVVVSGYHENEVISECMP